METGRGLLVALVPVGILVRSRCSFAGGAARPALRPDRVPRIDSCRSTRSMRRNTSCTRSGTSAALQARGQIASEHPLLKGNFGDERMVLGLRQKGACTISGLGALERRIAGNGY
jgi:hypothetical protein